MKRLMALLLTAALICGLGCPAMAAPGGPGGPPDGPFGGAPGGGPGGGPEMREGDMAATGNSVNTGGLITVVDGRAEANAALSACISQKENDVFVDDLSYCSDHYSTTLISTSGSTVSIRNASVNMTVSEEITGSEQAGTALYTDSGTTVIEDSEISVDGAGRYTLAAVGDATMVVSNSVIEAGGDSGAEGKTASVSEPASNAGLLISGTSRANFSVGETHTFYYDSLCVTDGWAALSTDSATGSGLEFVAVDTEAVALHGGYGIYSDTSCRDYLYGTALVSAEVGGIISNNGSIQVFASEDVAGAVTQDGIDVLAYAEDREKTGTGRSLIIAGRNDFQIHSPDMMGDGNSDYSAGLTLNHTDLITDDAINQDGYEYISQVNGEQYLVQAETDYTEKYGEAIGAYVDYVSGAAILVKSTSAEIELNDVTVDSCSGTALLSALNSDSMSRYLKKDVGNGVRVSVRDSVIDGDFIHDDYQRDMEITLSGATLNGAVTYTTYEEWNERWADFASDENCCWANLDASVYITETHDTVLALTEGSVWDVAGESRLTELRVSENSVVEGIITAEEMNTLEDGTTVYHGVSVAER